MAKTQQSQPKVYVAVDSFVCNYDGADHVFRPDGPFVREGHPILTGREHMFREVTAHPSYEVEQATAAPGERRGQ